MRRVECGVWREERREKREKRGDGFFAALRMTGGGWGTAGGVVCDGQWSKVVACSLVCPEFPIATERVDQVP